MSSPTAPTVDANGISAPTYAQILDYLQTQYRSIFGADVYLGNDSQDGQFLGIIAAAINDANAAAIAVYNSFSPATAQGNGLSSVVKINGIARAVPSNSQVALTIVGVVGTVITNGVAMDSSRNLWNLPPSVTIPVGGSIVVTATAQVPGAIAAAPATVTGIATPTLGWQSVTNVSSASLGAPVESDASLRKRQAQSVALPAQTILSAIVGAVQAVTGVTAVRAYENDTSSTDVNGLPAKSIALIVRGGNATAIATAIMNKKAPGVATFGSTTVALVDAVGITQSIKFSAPVLDRISVAITVKGLSGYTADVGDRIKAAIADYINALQIGQAIFYTRLFLPAMLNGDPTLNAYEVQSIAISKHPATPTAADVAIAFDHLASCAIADIALTVV